mmetsp:Transcript_12832/g.32863  ORF Transcript_12832/g.32863 Transcript_12832/m.32863 type:complete len:236 (-) Transcript_12832:262-969(-)|eukprot:CAMPEP_0182941456 /NCGR_PEP_ID=MMETSP0105_2-20130417/48970_1 /TAXON_ID=81532 ORGANISM="Acanthoeca-like sp., Strain 10tr" /NCGR_SAMPLE_ID=MMETSP0105_2 /ASSEMBLY_ACC=CAM_ASM_000205 /LENGTH=235 /DNA_ID=CAMNT_0025081077 /DNA_START=167 /DNA_END=874 /DNA_ORIENTATION=-
MAGGTGCWGWPIVFWTLAWGRVIWSIVDLGLDTAYLATVIYGDEFSGHSSAQSVRVAATSLLVADFLIVFAVEAYLITVKRRFARQGWLDEPGYLYNISWYEFKALLAVTLIEDIPQLVILTYVSNVTNSFDTVAKLQLATAVISMVYFVAQAIRNYRLHAEGYRTVKEGTEDRSKELRADAAAKLKRGRIKSGAKAGVKAIKEPKRAKKSQAEFAAKDSAIKEHMTVMGPKSSV